MQEAHKHFNIVKSQLYGSATRFIRNPYMVVRHVHNREDLLEIRHEQKPA